MSTCRLSVAREKDTIKFWDKSAKTEQRECTTTTNKRTAHKQGQDKVKLWYETFRLM
jgi:hypothetical protein